MATSVNSNFKIYDTLVQTSYLERIQDNLAAFNAASRMALQYVSTIIAGDFSKQAFYQIGGTVTDRDVTSTADVTPDNIGAGEMVGVKKPWKYGPFATTEEAFKRRARSPQEFSVLMGQDMADAILKYAIQLSLAALNGAIGCNTGMIVDDKSISTDGKTAITAGLRLMGDKFNNIACLVMHSTSFFDFVDQAIGAKIFEEAGMVIYGAMPGTLGKPVLVTDVCSSTKIYGLQPGAVLCTESQMPGVKSYERHDKENFEIGYAAEGVFNLDVMGYSWDTVTGSTNPTAAALATAANWDKHATDNKNTAGFILDLSASS